MAQRPVWWEAKDARSMAELLQQNASATTLDASPRPAPGSASVAMLHHAAVHVARQALAEAHAGRDRILMEEVRAIDDLLRASNLMIERLREWYGLHAPDVTRSITDAEHLARLVAEHGDRAAVVAVLNVADGLDIGAALDPADLAVMQGFAAALRGLHESWRAIEARVEQLMQEVAPNIRSVAGANVGARLIALAGGLHRLGTMSAGTIQTLGAETALFRHIKEGTLPPKHGVVFQHLQVFQAPRHQRGAVARALANHVALASRADATTGNDITEFLRTSLEDDFERIARKPVPARPARGANPRGPARGAPKGGPRGTRGPPSGKKPYANKSGPRKPQRSGAPPSAKGPGGRGPNPRGPKPGGPSGPAKPPGRGRP